MVYIQSNNERTIPHHFDAACALYGALDSNQNYRLTSFEEVSSGKFDALIKTNLFVGSVEFMTEVFKRAGKIVPSMKPSQSAETLWLSKAIERVKKGEEFFIKPVQTKLFSGMVFDLMCISTLEKYPQETEVYVSAPFWAKILSEWRFYIRNKEIIDARNYSGDFRVTPNFKFADDHVHGKWSGDDFTDKSNFPVCYTMDIAILGNSINTNVIVEYNDMWAIGNYGIDNYDYYKLLRERYFEIMRS